MRRRLRRKAVTIAAAILAFTAMATTGIVAHATPAFGAISADECNAHGHMYCVDVPAPFGNGNAVVLGNGRLVQKQDMNYKCCGSHEVYRIHFVADTTQCMGVNHIGYITVRDCSGGDSNGVNWAWEPGTVDGEWFNTSWRGFLVSDNTFGDQLFVIASGCTSCWYTWTLI